MWPRRSSGDHYSTFRAFLAALAQLTEIEDFIEGFNQPTYRGMRGSMGSGVATWSSQHGWSGM
jgi:hypothetical protein